MTNAKTIVLVVAVLTLAALACSIGGPGDQPAQPEDQPAPEVATLAPDQAGDTGSGTSPTEAADTSAPGSAEQDLTMSNLTEGLASLNSYKSTFSVKFAGQDEQSQQVSLSWDTHEEFIREPRAQRLAVTTSGTEAQQTPAGTFEWITIGDTSYMITQEQGGAPSCISVSSDSATPPEQGVFSPNMLGDINGAKYVNTESVNGVQAKHYSWNDSGGLLGLGFTAVKGEAWVAVDGNYVVKYLSEANGKGGLLTGSSQAEGTMNFEYNLNEVNGSFTIAPPDGCQTAATDIPIMADATDKSSFGEMTTYTTASAFADVVQFYKNEMPNNGWQPGGEPTEMEGVAMLAFTKDNRNAQLMITFNQDEQKVNVVITTNQQ
jgi:hypothetical protein